MPKEDVLELVLTFKNDSNEDDIDKRIQQVLLPIMEFNHQSNEYLRNICIKKLQNDVDIYPIVRSLKTKVIFTPNQFDQFIRDLVFHVNSITQLPICQQLLSLIQQKQDLEYVVR